MIQAGETNERVLGILSTNIQREIGVTTRIIDTKTALARASETSAESLSAADIEFNRLIESYQEQIEFNNLFRFPDRPPMDPRRDALDAGAAALVQFQVEQRQQQRQLAEEFTRGIVFSFRDSIQNFVSGETDLGGFIRSAFDALTQHLINSFIDSALDSVTDAITSGDFSFGDIFSGFFGLLGGGGDAEIESIFGGIDSRQFGGPVSANQPVLVGEAGRELFVPSASGEILSNDQLNDVLGNNQEISIPIQIVGDVSRQTRDEIVQMVPLIADRVQSVLQRRRLLRS